MKKKYYVVDSLFSKEDIERILERNIIGIKEWDENRLGGNIRLSNDRGLSYGNFINQPYYSLNGKYAIVQHNSVRTFSSFYIFERKKDDWVFIDSVKGVW